MSVLAYSELAGPRFNPQAARRNPPRGRVAQTRRMPLGVKGSSNPFAQEADSPFRGASSDRSADSRLIGHTETYKINGWV